jgi:hypothetical protein
MWFRKTTDPLGKLLFEKYGVHVLSRPRQHVSVFQVFGVRDGEVFQSGDIDGFLHSQFDKPEVAMGEVMADIDGTTSDALVGTVAVNFLQGFLALIGAGAAKTVSGALKKSDSRTLRFQFGGCTRDHVKDDFDLENRLSDFAFDKDKSAMKAGCRYYIATGVQYCNRIKFEALDKNMAKIDMSADVPVVAAGEIGLSVDRDRQITATSDKLLAYGVELNEIRYDEKRKRLGLQGAQNHVQVRGAGAGGLPKAMIGGPEDTMILRIADRFARNARVSSGDLIDGHQCAAASPQGPESSTAKLGECGSPK